MPAGTPSYGRSERYAGEAPVESIGASAAGVPIPCMPEDLPPPASRPTRRKSRARSAGQGRAMAALFPLFTHFTNSSNSWLRSASVIDLARSIVLLRLARNSLN